jgi:hypothetical protein
MTDESNFWAGFGAIESQGVALRFLDNKFYFGTVISADDRDKTVSILFNDEAREDKVSITDDDLVFFRGKCCMICATCAEPDADLICKVCKASFHFACLYPFCKDRRRGEKLKGSKTIGMHAWKCHACTTAENSVIEYRNEMLSETQLSTQHCAMCGHMPIPVQNRKSHALDIYGISQCEQCRAVHCWTCTAFFLGNKEPYKCFRCKGGINVFNQDLDSNFGQLAELVEKEIGKRSLGNAGDKSRGVGAQSKAAAKPKTQRAADSNLESPVFVTFANTMMCHQKNLNPLSFPKHFGLFLRMIVFLLKQKRPIPITPYDVLRIMGFDPRVTLDMLILVSQQTIFDLGLKDLSKFIPRAMSSTGILNIGILCGDFGGLHPTPNLLRCLFDFLDGKKFQLTVFSTSQDCAEVQADLLQGRKHAFFTFEGEGRDQEIALRIREREIDFLFDINGHTHGGSPKGQGSGALGSARADRLLGICRRPACPRVRESLYHRRSCCLEI